MPVDGGVVRLSAAAHDDHAFGALAPRERAGGVRCASASEHGDALARKPDARRAEREQHAESVGVVCDEFSSAVDHGVDRAAFHGGGVQLVDEGHDRAFVRYGDIHPLEFARGKERGERVLFHLQEGVIARAELPVQAGGVTVPQRVADEPEFHPITS